MEFGGKKLLLDNFRSVLQSYSVDIQDVVRSAILDDVDITGYIIDCKNNPFRLDQIRLALKDRLPKEYYKFDGDTIYEIRHLFRNGLDIGVLEKQSGGLSKEYLDYLLKWVSEGINLSGLNIATIPKNLLGVFDYGLSNGFDMLCFNNGKSYTPGYIRSCLQIIKAGKPLYCLLSGEYSIEVLNCLLAGCKSISESNWKSLLLWVLPSYSKELVENWVSIAQYDIDLRLVSEDEIFCRADTSGALLGALRSNNMGLVDRMLNATSVSDVLAMQSGIFPKEIKGIFGKRFHT